MYYGRTATGKFMNKQEWLAMQQQGLTLQRTPLTPQNTDVDIIGSRQDNVLTPHPIVINEEFMRGCNIKFNRVIDGHDIYGEIIISDNVREVLKHFIVIEEEARLIYGAFRFAVKRWSVNNLTRDWEVLFIKSLLLTGKAEIKMDTLYKYDELVRSIGNNFKELVIILKRLEDGNADINFKIEVSNQ